MINIANLMTSLLFASAVAVDPIKTENATAFNNEPQIKEAYKDIAAYNYNLNLNLTLDPNTSNVISSGVTIPFDSQFTQYTGIRYRTDKAFANNANNALSVEAVVTQQHLAAYTSINYIMTPVTRVNNTNENQIKQTSILRQYKITPYLFNANTNLKINTVTRFQIPTGNNRDYTNLYFKNELIMSTNEYAGSLFDISNYATQGRNYEIFNNLKNSSYVNDYKRIDTELTFSGNQQRVTTTFEIGIPKIKNENALDNIQNIYIYILQTPYTKNVNNEGNLTGDNNTYVILQSYYGAGLPFTINGVVDQITGTAINGSIDYEYIDIPGMMFQILTMPFSFISIAFNLTLFPGTPYQVNISNLFTTIIGVLIFVFLIKKLVNLGK